MLSRLAWQFYWAGRKLERIELLARALLAQEVLSYHPQGDALANRRYLLNVFEQEDLFAEHGGDSQTDMFNFLFGSAHNPASLYSLVGSLRDDMRSMHGLLPAEMWRFSGRLKEYTATTPGATVKRRQRLDDIIRYCRASAGIATTAMLRDMPFYFWQIGRRLECADMTCHLLVGERNTAIVDGGDDEPSLRRFRWATFLSALGVTEAYRSSVSQNAYNAAAITAFIMHDMRLPRAVCHCLSDVREGLKYLPSNEKSLLTAARAAQVVAQPIASGKRGSVVLERTLTAIAALDKTIAKSYFPDL